MRLVQISLLSLPLEIKWEIIKRLDIESARRASKVLQLSLLDIYRYFAFELVSCPNQILDVLKELSNLIQDNATYYRALLLNKRFQKIDIHFSFLLATGFELTDILERLLRNPSLDPRCWNNLPLLVSAANGKTRIVSFLLNDPRVDPSAMNNSALDLAIKFGHSDIISILENDDRVKRMDNYQELIVRKNNL